MKLGIIIRREYLERVGKKSFIITTILMPLFMVLLMALPAIMIMWVGESQSTVVVLDNTRQIAQQMQSSEDVSFLISTEPLDSALKRKDVDGILVIPANTMKDKQAELKFYTPGPSSVTTEKNITRQVNDIIEQMRLKERNLGDLQQILAEVASDVTLANIRTDKEDQEEASTGLSYGIGIGMAFLLYMFLIIYGQMIMTSIIEEKNNRVLEIVVSSVQASTLMMGKILGVALVALTQILIWAIILLAVLGIAGPQLLQPEILAQMGFDANISSILNVPYLAMLIVEMTLFLMVGFLFYASIYAAIGSAVDNIQDGSQLQMLTIFPILIGLLLAMSVIANPTSTLALITGLIPFTSPMVMVSRLAFDIPAWQVWVSLAILALSFWGMVKIAGKIYRVGIFMYGKKPSVKEIIRWINYK